jgi:hypothetical protein
LTFKFIFDVDFLAFFGSTAILATLKNWHLKNSSGRTLCHESPEMRMLVI